MSDGITTNFVIVPEDRPTWDQTWLDQAEIIGRRSLCVRDRVGAVIVDRRNRPLVSAYNGPPSGFDHDGTPCVQWCPRAMAKIIGWHPPSFDFHGPPMPELKFEHERWYERRLDGLWTPIDDLERFMRNHGCEPIYDLDSDYRDCPSLHAEANAISRSDESAREGGTIYVTSHSCHNCCKLVANSGLARLVVRPRAAADHRRSDAWYVFLRRCGIVVDIIT